MKKAKYVIVDTDPGIDDAVALACAFYQKKYKISLLCASGGNLNTNITSKNCLDLSYYFKKRIPVAKGADMPINGILNTTAADVHGKNGLGNVILPASPYKVLKDKAHEAMYSELVKNGKKNTDIWLIGPATNIARMLNAHKDATDYINRIVLMGASVEGVANSLEIYDEFNILYDPQAMKILIDSGVKLVFVPMEIGHNCYLNFDEIDKIEKMNKTGELFAQMLRNHRDGHVTNGAAMHDAAVVYFALHERRFEKHFVFTHINLEGKNVGQVEFSLAPQKTKNILCFSTDVAKFKKWLFKIFKKFK